MDENVLSAAEIRRALSGRIPALDGLRGIAILLVLVFHFSWVPLKLSGIPAALLSVIDSGWAGVELFFVLSGFLITGILIDSKNADNYFSSFYMRRALRILPLYYGALLVVFILLPILGKSGIPFLPRELTSAQIWYWLYAGNWAWFWNREVYSVMHFWSLAVEEQFYLVWPLIIAFTSRRRAIKACVSLVLAGLVLRVVLHFREADFVLVYVSTWAHLDVLAMGALAAFVVRDEYWTRMLRPHLNKVMYAGLLCFILIGIVNRNFTFGSTFVFGAFPLSIFFSALLLLSVVTTGLSSPLQRVLRMPWLRSYGKYSYAIYVIHGLLLRPYFNIFIPRLASKLQNSPLRAWLYHPGFESHAVLGILLGLNVVGNCALMLGIGKLSWWAFEGRFNRFKDRFEIRWKSQNVPNAQASGGPHPEDFVSQRES